MDYCSGMSGLSGPSGALSTTGLVDEVSEAEVVPNEPLYFSFITLVVQSTHYIFLDSNSLFYVSLKNSLFYVHNLIVINV